MLCIRFRFPCLHPSGSAGVSLASSPVIFPRDSLRTPKRRLFPPICFILRGKRWQKSDKKALFYQFLSRPAPADWRQGRELLPPSSQPQVCKVCRRGRAFCLRPAAPGRKAGIWSEPPPRRTLPLKRSHTKKSRSAVLTACSKAGFPAPSFQAAPFIARISQFFPFLHTGPPAPRCPAPPGRPFPALSAVSRRERVCCATTPAGIPRSQA